MDFRLGAIEQLTKERERENGQTEKHQIVQYKNIKEMKVCMHENAWTCDMQT